MGLLVAAILKIKLQDLPACLSGDHRMPPAVTRRKILLLLTSEEVPCCYLSTSLVLCCYLQKTCPGLRYDLHLLHPTLSAFPHLYCLLSSYKNPTLYPIKLEAMTFAQMDFGPFIVLYGSSPLFLLMILTGSCPFGNPWITTARGTGHLIVLYITQLIFSRTTKKFTINTTPVPLSIRSYTHQNHSNK